MALNLKLTDQERLQNLRSNLKLARGYLLDAHTEALALGYIQTFMELRAQLDELDQLRARL